MADPLVWPSILVPASEAWNPNFRASKSGGRSMDNAEQIVAGPTGYVTATLTVPCKERAKILAMRALLAALDGRAGKVLVGPVEVTRAPWFVDPLTGARIAYGAGRADAAVDPAYGVNPDTSASLAFHNVQAAAMNATAMTIQRDRGGLIEPGMMFSIGGRLHVVIGLDTADPGAAAGYAIPGRIGIRFRPWLRADYPAGTPIEFGTPVCTMRLANDDTGALELQLSRLGTVTLDLVEAF